MNEKPYKDVANKWRSFIHIYYVESTVLLGQKRIQEFRFVSFVYLFEEQLKEEEEKNTKHRQLLSSFNGLLKRKANKNIERERERVVLMLKAKVFSQMFAQQIYQIKLNQSEERNVIHEY